VNFRSFLFHSDSRSRDNVPRSWRSAIDLRHGAIADRLKYPGESSLALSAHRAGGETRRIGNPWERRNSQESHPAVSDGIVRYCARRARQYKTTRRYLGNLMPREPVFGARDRIFLPEDPSKKTVPPPSRPFARLRSRIIAFSARLSRDARFISPDLVAFPWNILFSRYIAHRNAHDSILQSRAKAILFVRE